MSALAITNSTKISSLDIKTIFNLNTGKISVDLSPSVFIADGAQNVNGASLKIISPSGYEVSDGLSNVFTPNMDQVIEKNIPKINEILEYGIYQLIVVLDDATNTYTLKKNFRLCAPTDDGKSNTGELDLTIDVNCATGYAIVYGGEGIPYNGIQATSWTKNLSYYFPQGNGNGAAPQTGITHTPFTVVIYTGVNKVKGVSVGQFDLADNFTVIIRYEGEFEKDIRCNLDFCHLYEGMAKIYAIKKSENCDTLAYREAIQKINEAQPLMNMILFGYMCGNNIDDFITEMEKIIGKNCGCHKSKKINFVSGGVGVLPEVLTAATIEPNREYMKILTQSGFKMIQFVDVTSI